MRRLRDWWEAGVWDGLHAGCCDGCGPPTGATGAGPASTAHPWLPNWDGQDGAEPDRLKQARHDGHPITERSGIPLAFVPMDANTHDSMPFEELLDSIPPVGGKTSPARSLPDKLHAIKTYDW